MCCVCVGGCGGPGVVVVYSPHAQFHMFSSHHAQSHTCLPPSRRRRLPGSDMGYPTDAPAGGSTLSGVPSTGGDQPGPVVGCSVGLDCHLLRINA